MRKESEEAGDVSCLMVAGKVVASAAEHAPGLVVPSCVGSFLVCKPLKHEKGPRAPLRTPTAMGDGNDVAPAQTARDHQLAI